MKPVKFVVEVSLVTVLHFVICAFNKKDNHFAHTEDNVYVCA
jgi:hypothetical protein